MYHPAYTGPTAAAIAQGQVLDLNKILHPPANEKWIIAHSDKQQAESTTKRKDKKKSKSHAQVDANPFDTKNMRQYVDNKEGT